MITPANENFDIVIGDDFTFEFDIETDGQILNLTNAQVYCQIRKGQGRNSELVTNVPAYITIGEETGYLSDVKLALTDLQTVDLLPGSYYHSVLVVNGVGGSKTTYCTGKAVVSPAPAKEYV